MSRVIRSGPEFLLAACTVMVLCVLLNGRITDEPIRGDARQNLQAAYNIYTWGVFSKGAAPAQAPAPDNYREPFPPYVTAAYMALLGTERFCLHGDCYEHGFNDAAVKRVNIVWAAIVLSATAVLSGMITRSSIWTIAVLVLLYCCYLRSPESIDGLYTEVPASACMLVAALCLRVYVKRGGVLMALATGCSLGILALTKALFWYVLMLTLPVAALLLLVRLRPVAARKALKGVVLLCIGLVATVGPWLVRNAVQCGTLHISGRGGLALYTRALINQMDPFEYRASLHCWGPGAYRWFVRTTFLDVNRADYGRGGRAARLNCAPDADFFQDDIRAWKDGRPEDALSFFAIARAQRKKAQDDAKRAGYRHPAGAADAYLRGEAAAMIVRKPLRHLLATPALAWRGMWCFYGGGALTVLGAAAYGSFCIVCLYGACRRRGDIMAFAAIPMLLVAGNAFLTNNLPRFNAPAIPFMVISLVCALQTVLRFTYRRSVRQDTNKGG